MTMEVGKLKEAIKKFPFWFPLLSIPAIVEMESLYFLSLIFDRFNENYYHIFYHIILRLIFLLKEKKI